MLSRILLFTSLATLTAHAATGNNPAQEYEQVKRIALRDARVRDAYEQADARLEAKILAIDPSLEPYIHGRKMGAPTTSTHAREAAPHRAVTAAPSPRPPARAHGGKTCVVAKGETLGVIAHRYGTTVAELKTLNHIADERKLRAGQILTLPAHAAPGRAATTHAAPKAKGWWDRAWAATARE